LRSACVGAIFAAALLRVAVGRAYGRAVCQRTFACPRRSVGFGAALGGLLNAPGARAQEAPTPGTVRLQQVIAENGLEDWKTADYEAMRDDSPRTDAFEAAIKRRLQSLGDQAVVVDIGTGSFALLALMAARAGAKRVFAIEKNPEAVKLAREAVRKAGFEGTVQVIEGDSMQTELPERVDLVVSELIGSIATQEGVEPIIRDADKRFLKDGIQGARMIPARCQTLIAPVKYTEHRIMSFASKRGIMSRGKQEEGTLKPLRLRSKTSDLNFLTEPQILEDFDYSNPGASRQLERTLHFDIPASVANEAKDFSGFAMWTRVVVDDQSSVEVRGQKKTSHWAYVVALMGPQPVAIAAPGSIELKSSIDYAASPVRYSLDATAVV